MSLRPLSQSIEKSAVFSRLGLTDQIYTLMLDEAALGRDRLSSNPANLTPQSRVDTRVQQPYRWDQLSETAKHREILYIVNVASASTRPYFDRGRYNTHVNEENWVARWFLWHSFRYRDNRDHKAQANGGK
ncbi:hypothetical protein K505DRAFT_289042 [Melanomma pulvis-pyrius CBS 109.77]|uniref:Uncharacterized protein n=1 Tax=Melanomma pulvis-pyrius CBS 109.77 TaxID=1314802 RepID=A0A6A6WSC0_9PLEO|nr:hypothetical protein K505DRAFT_289042 [Melanomma pulvis-pyrius CBS 109.77]